MKRFLTKSARQFAVDIGGAIRGKEVYDSRIADYNLMKEMGWTKEELDRTPENDVMSTKFIMNRTAPKPDKGKGDMKKDGGS